MRVNGKADSAHRVGYELQIGPIPAGLSVLHKCDNRACVRADHLFLGTQLDNMRDCASKGRNPNRNKGKPNLSVRGELSGKSKLTEVDVREIWRLWDSGLATIKELAAKYGMSTGGIRHLVKRERWAWLSE